MGKVEELEKLKNEIIERKVCSGLAVSATNLVFGDGSVDAQILFIGEAPGKQEDLKGLPFVGAAGKFLNEMLDSIKLSREDVYITNIVKYRPPENRDPSEEEKESFLPYLISQINIIKPKIVITLGRHSMNCFMPKAKISEVHGKLNSIKFVFKNQILNMNLLPLFHPAAALYNGGLRGVLIEDFSRIPNLIKELNNKSN